MKYGMNLLLWTDHLHDGLLPVLENLKRMGYDGVELPLFAPDAVLPDGRSGEYAGSVRES